MLGNVGSFDGAAVGRACGDGDEVVAVYGLTGRRAQLDELKAGPEGSERQPPLAISVDEQVRVDRVVVAAVRRFDYETQVGPRAGGASFTRREKDRGPRCAEARGRVVHVVLAVMIGEIRRPQVLVAIGVSSRPRSAIRKCSADVIPGDAVPRCLETNAVGREGSEIGAIGFLNYSGIVDEGVAVNRTRVDGSLLQGRGEGSDGEDASGEDAVEGDHGAKLCQNTGLEPWSSKEARERLREVGDSDTMSRGASVAICTTNPSVSVQATGQADCSVSKTIVSDKEIAEMTWKPRHDLSQNSTYETNTLWRCGH